MPSNRNRRLESSSLVKRLWLPSLTGLAPLPLLPLLLGLLILTVTGLATSLPASAREVLVLYPRVEAPYQALFRQLIAGIEDVLGSGVESIVLEGEAAMDEARQWTRTHPADGSVIVALGQRALTVYPALETTAALIAGGIREPVPDHVQRAISAVIDPLLYLQTLRQLKPAVTRVAVVHPARQDSLIGSIVAAGHRLGLTIEPVAVNDVETAARATDRLLATADPATTALWFTAGTLEINPSLLLPFVLEESWRRGLAVFSGDTVHTRRGFLFALYPDYVGMGRELGLAIQALDTRADRLPSGTLTYTRAARLALNRRTARHLGLILDRSILERADLIFPTP